MIPIWTFIALFVLVTIYSPDGREPVGDRRIALIVPGSIGIAFWFTSGDVTTDDASGPGYLNGSLQYLPALLALVVFAAVTLVQSPSGAVYVTAAGGRLPAVIGLSNHRLDHLRGDWNWHAFHVAYPEWHYGRYCCLQSLLRVSPF